MEIIFSDHVHAAEGLSGRPVRRHLSAAVRWLAAPELIAPAATAAFVSLTGPPKGKGPAQWPVPPIARTSLW